MKIEPGSFWVMKNDPKIRAEVLSIHPMIGGDWVAYKRNHGPDVSGRFHSTWLFLETYEPAPEPFFRIGKEYTYKGSTVATYLIEDLYTSPDQALAMRFPVMGESERYLLSAGDFKSMIEVG